MSSQRKVGKFLNKKPTQLKNEERTLVHPLLAYILRPGEILYRVNHRAAQHTSTASLQHFNLKQFYLVSSLSFFRFFFAKLWVSEDLV